MRYSTTLVAFLLIAAAPPSTRAADSHVPWQAQDYAIAEPLGGLRGDPERGRDIARNKDRGNCLACHRLPIPEEAFHGTVGPPLEKVASRLSEGQVRLRIVDESLLVPNTIMPAFHKDPADLNRVADAYYGKPVLTAQEVEDVVAYLMTLR